MTTTEDVDRILNRDREDMQRLLAGPIPDKIDRLGCVEAMLQCAFHAQQLEEPAFTHLIVNALCETSDEGPPREEKKPALLTVLKGLIAYCELVERHQKEDRAKNIDPHVWTSITPLVHALQDCVPLAENAYG